MILVNLKEKVFILNLLGVRIMKNILMLYGWIFFCGEYFFKNGCMRKLLRKFVYLEIRD